MQYVFPQLAGQTSRPRIRRTIDHGRQNKAEVYDQTRPRHRGDRLRIVELLQVLGSQGATRHELAEHLQLPLTTICGRVSELKQMGEVIELGTRRPTPNGKTATVLTYVALTPPTKAA